VSKNGLALITNYKAWVSLVICGFQSIWLLRQFMYIHSINRNSLQPG